MSAETSAWEVVTSTWSAVIALAQLAWLTPFMVSSTHVSHSTIPGSGWEVRHSCLSSYFVASEALANVSKYADASQATIRVTRTADHVEVEVADDGGNAARPLLGIRERVALSGGQLRAGARRDGGHVVRARLPLGGPA